MLCHQVVLFAVTGHLQSDANCGAQKVGQNQMVHAENKCKTSVCVAALGFILMQPSSSYGEQKAPSKQRTP